MSDFILYALLAGLGGAAVAGSLGCFVIWRRMSYFGGTLAHSALLSVALGLLLDLNVNLTVAAVRIALIIMTALVIVISMKVVGVLLITALLIITDATREIRSTQEQIALNAGLVAMLRVILGLVMSWQWDTPAGPSMVVCATLFFVLSQLKKKRV